MSQPRWGARLAAAAVAVVVPLSLWTSAPALGAQPAPQPSAPQPSARWSVAMSTAGATVSLAAYAPGVMALQRDALADVPPMVVAPRTTIRGTLSLRTRAERHRKIEVTSAKGTRTWTASSLAEHDVPSAAMRAYRHAARTIDTEVPGCHLPWTLLAGIGRVESDHGRYGGSVLGADGVSRPAIIGVALNGTGAVAAVHDTDHGRFDGDTVWDRAVGPMQFIPSTWRTAGRDGDGDGVRSPNDIDDASLAAAAYLCHGGRDLARTADQRSAIFSYNPSGYYVDLVSAFAHGYATGSFVIPSPPVAPGAGDGLGQARAAAAKAAASAKAKHARHLRALEAARARAHRAQHRVTHHVTHHRPTPRPTPTPSPQPTPTPTPTPKPTPKPPVLKTAHGPVVAAVGGWTIAGVRLTTADLSPIADKDYDGNGTVEPVSAELDGLARTGTPATLTYYDQPSFKVNGFSV